MEYPKEGKPIRLAGDVIEGPWDPAETAFNIRAAKTGLAQRGLQYNDKTGQWEDIEAKIIPMTPKGKK